MTHISAALFMFANDHENTSEFDLHEVANTFYWVSKFANVMDK